MKYDHKQELKSKAVVAEMAAARLARTQQVNEGPLDRAWAGVKGAATGIMKGSPVKGAKAGYNQQAGVDANSGEINEIVTSWNQLAGQIGATGRKPTSQDLQTFLAKQLPDANITVKMNDAGLADPQKVFDQVSKAVHQQSVNSQLGQPQQPGNTQQGNVPAGTATPVAPVAPSAPAQASAYKQILSLLPQLKDPSQINKLLKSVTSMSQTVANATATTTVPPAAPAAPAPAAQEPIKIGGQTINPTDPLYAKISQQMQQQAPAPAAPAVAPAALAAPSLGPNGQPLDKSQWMDSKINDKPAIKEAQLKKLANKKAVLEAALRKAKRDRGII